MATTFQMSRLKGYPTITALSVALLLCGCSKPATSTESTPQETAPTPALAPLTSTGPEKMPPLPRPDPLPPQKVYAPEGTLYTVQRVTITTDDGVFSVAGGTKLKVLRKTGSGYVVHDGRREFPVEAQQVTNELLAAGAAAQITNAEREAANIAAANMRKGSTTSSDLPPPAVGSGSLPPISKERVRNLQAKKVQLNAEIVDLKDKVSRAVVNGSTVRSASLSGRGAALTVDNTLLDGWKRRLAGDLEEIRQIDTELAQAGPQ